MRALSLMFMTVFCQVQRTEANGHTNLLASVRCHIRRGILIIKSNICPGTSLYRTMFVSGWACKFTILFEPSHF